MEEMSLLYWKHKSIQYFPLLVIRKVICKIGYEDLELYSIMFS